MILYTILTLVTQQRYTTLQNFMLYTCCCNSCCCSCYCNSCSCYCNSCSRCSCCSCSSNGGSCEVVIVIVEMLKLLPTILHYTILYLLQLIRGVLLCYYTILYYTVLYCTILYYSIPRIIDTCQIPARRWKTELVRLTILYYTLLYYTILYYTIQ